MLRRCFLDNVFIRHCARSHRNKLEGKTGNKGDYSNIMSNANSTSVLWRSPSEEGHQMMNPDTAIISLSQERLLFYDED